jgi:hypothetical protein
LFSCDIYKGAFDNETFTKSTRTHITVPKRKKRRETFPSPSKTAITRISPLRIVIFTLNCDEFDHSAASTALPKT